MPITELLPLEGETNQITSLTKGEFIQSWSFGDFLRSVGRDVRRFSFSSKEPKVFFQGIHQSLPFGISYLYLPRLRVDSELQLRELLTVFQEQKYTFLRLEPLIDIHVEKMHINPTYNRQPQNTWLLDIRDSEERLLANMHSKTRYNIRLAEKKGVVIKEESGCDIFWKLNQVTVERDQFKNHDRAYFEKLLKMPGVRQFVAWFNETPISAIILLEHEQTMYYFYGASANEYRNVMAPYLLQWQAIQYAKTQGCTQYDFWGVAAPIDEQDQKAQCFHSFCWDGSQSLSSVTRFKAGFGGYVKSYPSAVDIILDPLKYKVYKWMKKIQ